MRTRSLLVVVAAVFAVIAATIPAQAITNGTPDGQDHPYVGELLFYVPDEVDSRFPDPGSWFTCSGTLMHDHIVLTRGHCPYGVGLNGRPTTAAPSNGAGGNDVWINFSEVPDFSILPPSTSFATNAARYAAWRAALNASPQWHRATATPHPLFDNDAFFLHDAGVLQLAAPVSL